MTILPSPPEASAPLPPTSALPPISKIASTPVEDLHTSLLYLRLLYSPEVRGSRRIRPKPSSSRTPSRSPSKPHKAPPPPPSLDAIRADRFERTYALRWLTALVSRVDAPDADETEPLLQAAASLLAVCAGASAAGALTRSFDLGAFSVVLSDAPLENADYSSVGAQTCGACVLAEMLVEAPHRFGLSTATATTTTTTTTAARAPLRALELGAGTGLVSIALAKCAAVHGTPLDLVASDFHPPVLANLRANLAANLPPSGLPTPAIRARAAFLDWSAPAGTRPEPPFDAPFDLVLGADVVYELAHARWIHACVARLLRRTSAARFHLVVALRTGFGAETGGVERVFPAVEEIGRTDDPVLAIARREVIVCEGGSPAQVGKDAEEVEYGYYVIRWAGIGCASDDGSP
ncbi:hypothetical protein OF83DRAFT_1090941 [Amylostereum chailletii]|nr:hypothetical protein OF83DRAFT_1090941 [Amylostereum chailletii]